MRWDRRPVSVSRVVVNGTALRVTQEKLLLEVQSFKGITHLTKPNQEHSQYRPPFGVERLTGAIHLEHKKPRKPKPHSHQTMKTTRNISPDIESLQDSFLTSLSLNDDTMGRTDEARASFLSSSPSSLFHSDYVTPFSTLNQAYLTPTDEFTPNFDLFESSHKPAPDTTEIDMEELETLLNRYTSDIEWEDLPLSVQGYYLQQAHLEQVGDLCDKMEGVDLYEEQNHDWIAGGMYLVEDEVVEGSDSPYMVESATSSLLNTPPPHLSLGDGLVRKLEMPIENPMEAYPTPQSSPEPTPQYTPEVATPDPADSPIATNECSCMQGLRGVEFCDRDAQVRLRQLGLGHNELFQTLNALNAPCEPSLDAIHTNCPLNTFPSFAYPCYFADVIDEAKGMADRFGEVGELAMEVENKFESRKIQRSLSFVDQWVAA